MKLPKVVIFDMDGVIVDSEPRHERAFLEVIERLGYSGRHGIRFADYIGRTDKEIWTDFLRQHTPRETLEELLAMKRERVLEILRKEQPLFAGLPELAETLAAKYKLALASGSERAVIEEVLSFRNIGRFFSVTVSGTEVKRGKPAPDIFLKAAELLGVKADECWVVEDSKPGVAAAQAAGMYVIAVTNTHPAEELTHADRVVEDYQEIGDLLTNTRP